MGAYVVTGCVAAKVEVDVGAAAADDEVGGATVLVGLALERRGE